jgi:hypothetical protein
MGLGFTSTNDIKEEYTPLYKTIIECPICEQKDLMKIYKGPCACGNLHIDILEIAHASFDHFKTITYNEKEPLIYDVLLAEEIP